MIFYSFNTMTLRRASLMFETNDIQLIARVRLPKFIINRMYVRFMNRFDDMFSGDQVSNAVKEEGRKIALYNKIKNILPILYLGLLYEETDEMKELYLHLFGKEFTGGEDLLIIKHEIKRLSKRYKLMYDNPKETSEGVTLEELIVGVETILERSIDRGLRLYQFKTYYDLSLKKLADGRH